MNMGIEISLFNFEFLKIKGFFEIFFSDLFQVFFGFTNVWPVFESRKAALRRVNEYFVITYSFEKSFTVFRKIDLDIFKYLESSINTFELLSFNFIDINIFFFFWDNSTFGNRFILLSLFIFRFFFLNFFFFIFFFIYSFSSSLFSLSFIHIFL